MYNLNRGYVGASRSVGSYNTICDYEVPISLIYKRLIDEFLAEEGLDEFNEEDFVYLKSLSISKWVFVAKEKTEASSWHHTSSYFNKTNHYNLQEIAEKLIEMKETLEDEYKTYLHSQKDDARIYKFGVIKVEEWGGTRKHPRLLGYDEVAGIVVNDWLYYKNKYTGETNRYKISANKVVSLDVYESYEDLVKKHKKYKGTKRTFNKLISEKGSK